MTPSPPKLNFMTFFQFGTTKYDIYWANLYWFVTTVSTVGFGEFYPLNFIQRVYMTGIMIIAAMFFGYLVNAIGKFMLENQTQEISVKIKLANINSEFKEKNVQKDVSIRVLRYLEYALYQSNSDKNPKRQEILNSIHPALKFDVLKEIYVKIFAKMKGFSNISENVLAKLAQTAEECTFAPGRAIIDENERGDDLSLYFIESGSAIVFLKDSDAYLKELRSGEVFGEFSFFTGCKRVSSVKAKDYVTAIKFGRKKLINCLDGKGKEIIALFKNMVSIYSDYSSFDISCYSCRGKNHTAKNCKYTHLELNKRNLIRSKKVETNDRRSWIRRNRRPYIAITCQTEIISASFELNIEEKRARTFSNSMTDNYDFDIPTTNEKNEMDRKNQKRKSKRKTKQTAIHNEPKVEKVLINGFILFYENYNIERICQ